MPVDDALVLITMAVAAVITFSFWRQILVVVLLSLVTVFCFGLYTVATGLQG